MGDDVNMWEKPTLSILQAVALIVIIAAIAAIPIGICGTIAVCRQLLAWGAGG